MDDLTTSLATSIFIYRIMCPFSQPPYYAIGEKGKDAMHIMLDYSKKLYLMRTFKNYFYTRQLAFAPLFTYSLLLSPFPDSKSRLIMHQTIQLRNIILADNASASATISFVVIFTIGAIAG
jgi:hypothetical protein